MYSHIISLRQYLLECTSEYGISEDLHLEFPGPEERIVDFLEGKVGVYTKFFEFANFRLPISQFLFDILSHYQIHLSQLSVIGVAKDEMPVKGSYSAKDVAVLNTRGTPIQKQPEALLCVVGLSRRYFLGDDMYPTFLNDDDREMDLFNLISAPNPTKVKTGTHPRAAYKVPLLTDTANCVIAMEDAMRDGTTCQAQDKLSQETPRKRLRRPRSTRGGKSLAAMGLGADSTFTSAAQETPADVSDPEPLSYAKPQPYSQQDIAYKRASYYDRRSYRVPATEIPTGGVATTEVPSLFYAESPESKRSMSISSGHPELYINLGGV
ncbi:hypothetical protein Tco_1069025 [Tanacetum coccineum]|uniref:Transposase (Putative), gypsy type n=1 Tax=Tanacetum coccineum TaxID=301880 RepID=A0ABQ5HJJ0_9ASTR